jgi:Sec-independent protein translocase protein TatA
MDYSGVLAFWRLGLGEMILIGGLALLLFGPRLGRTLGQIGGALLRAKREVKGAKQGIVEKLERELAGALHGKEEEEKSGSTDYTDSTEKKEEKATADSRRLNEEQEGAER